MSKYIIRFAWHKEGQWESLPIDYPLSFLDPDKLKGSDDFEFGVYDLDKDGLEMYVRGFSTYAAALQYVTEKQTKDKQ